MNQNVVGGIFQCVVAVCSDTNEALGKKRLNRVHVFLLDSYYKQSTLSTLKTTFF